MPVSREKIALQLSSLRKYLIQTCSLGKWTEETFDIVSASQAKQITPGVCLSVMRHDFACLKYNRENAECFGIAVVWTGRNMGDWKEWGDEDIGWDEGKGKREAWCRRYEQPKSGLMERSLREERQRSKSWSGYENVHSSVPFFVQPLARNLQTNQKRDSRRQSPWEEWENRREKEVKRKEENSRASQQRKGTSVRPRFTVSSVCICLNLGEPFHTDLWIVSRNFSAFMNI